MSVRVNLILSVCVYVWACECVQVHRHYCGIAGEKNIDWAIQDCSQDGKG